MNLQEIQENIAIEAGFESLQDLIESDATIEFKLTLIDEMCSFRNQIKVIILKFLRIKYHDKNSRRNN